MSVIANSLRQAGLAELKAGRLDQALETMQKALQADPESFETWTYIGAIQSRRGEHDLARRAFGRAVQINPQSAKARFNLGYAHQMFGDLEAARVCYEAALSLEPGYEQAQTALSKLPKPGPLDMSALASVGGSVRLPGAQLDSAEAVVREQPETDEEPKRPLTPQEIAALSAPMGHIHLMGAQATDMDKEE